MYPLLNEQKKTKRSSKIEEVRDLSGVLQVIVKKVLGNESAWNDYNIYIYIIVLRHAHVAHSN